MHVAGSPLVFLIVGDECQSDGSQDLSDMHGRCANLAAALRFIDAPARRRGDAFLTLLLPLLCDCDAPFRVKFAAAEALDQSHAVRHRMAHLTRAHVPGQLVQDLLRGLEMQTVERSCDR